MNLQDETASAVASPGFAFGGDSSVQQQQLSVGRGVGKLSSSSNTPQVNFLARSSTKTASGGKDGFSFGRGRLSRSRHSPGLLGVPKLQAHAGHSDTPSLFFAAAASHGNHSKHTDVSPAAFKSADTNVADTEQESTDLDLLHCTTSTAVKDTVMGLSEAKRIAVQRLLCNPEILGAGKDCFAALQQCSSLGFLILSLQGYPGARTAGLFGPPDNWPGLGDLTNCLQHLVCLDISNCLMQDSHLQAISSSCHSLRALDISYSPHVTTAGVSTLLSCCTALEELDMSTCPAAVSDELMQVVAAHCPRLTSLYMEHDEEFAANDTQRGLGLSHAAYLTHGGLRALAAGCRELQVLSVAGQEVRSDDSQDQQVPTTSGSGLSALLVSCSQLTSLDLSLCTWVTEPELAGICAHGKVLQSLALSGAEALTDSVAQQLADSCKALTSLRLSSCPSLTDEGAQALAKGLPELTLLQLSGCTSLSKAVSSSLERSGLSVVHDGAFHAASGVKPAGAEHLTSGMDVEYRGADQQAAQQPAWNSLLSFLTSSAGAMNINSVRKGPRPGATATAL